MWLQRTQNIEKFEEDDSSGDVEVNAADLQDGLYYRTYASHNVVEAHLHVGVGREFYVGNLSSK